MPNLVKKFQNTCFQNELLKKGDRIILAISGGPDSISMLDIFSHLQKKYSLNLIIAHVNYGLRGIDSNRDEKFVRKLAKDYEIKIIVKKIKVSKNKISENILREIRYDFFKKLRADYNFDCIAVAHNADDQAETFLMRIIRGSGTSGLTAMKFKNGHIIRPLLSITRQEILTYIKENKLKYRIDKTNRQNKFLRNKIRNKLIPILEKNFNPKIKQTIFDYLVSISEDSQYLEKTALKNSKGLEIKRLEKLHPAILRRVLRNNIKDIKGDLKNISANNIKEIIKIIKSTKNKTQAVVMSGLKIIKKSDKLIIIKN